MADGAQIKARIKALGLTQSEVAERSGLSPGFLSDVINNKKRLGLDGARRIAPALDMPVTDLLEEATGDVDQWFWPAKFASLSTDELGQLRRMSIEDRIRWTLQQVQEAYPDLNLAERLSLEPNMVDELIAGRSYTTEPQIRHLTNTFGLPEHFLQAGEPGPNTDLARFVLSRHNATEWLSVIKFAMDNDVPPVKVLDAIRLFLSAVR